MARSKLPDFHGIVVVDKPAGITSHDVVARCRKIFGQRQVGHAGTLDPGATGVLLIGLGRATRLLRYSSESRKAYRGTVVFGTATSTLDADGEVTERIEMAPTRADVVQAAATFVGEIQQVPPMVSAIKIDGKRLHALARDGIEVERPARTVTIYAVEVEECSADTATIRVECSSGTYIRTLAADLGAALGGCAHLRGLRRLAVGSFTLDEARSLDNIAADAASAVLPPAAAVRSMASVKVDAAVAQTVAHGATFAASQLVGCDAGPGPFSVFDEAGELLAVYERRGERGVKPAVVLMAGSPQ